MRTARLKEEGKACYHCMSRIVDRQFLMNNSEKGKLRNLMRGLAVFSGIKVLTYCFLDNHFHLLLEVPARIDISDEELERRLSAIYPKDFVEIEMGVILGYRMTGEDDLAEQMKQRYTYRMYDVSEFMKSFKQCYTQSYNKRHDRKGTMWEERFNSVLVEGSEHVLLAMAAYIDLNPVRAGIVKDPKDYRYCGYGEAVGGMKEARRGLMGIIKHEGVSGSWKDISALYRKQLFVVGETRGTGPSGEKLRVSFSREQVEHELENNGHLPVAELLRCRVRYFSDGLAIGSKEYVESVFEKHRDQFGAKRKTGARKMRGGGWGDLCTVRDLRLNPITIST